MELLLAFYPKILGDGWELRMMVLLENQGGGAGLDYHITSIKGRFYWLIASRKITRFFVFDSQKYFLS